jgi:hypothetical protein
MGEYVRVCYEQADGSYAVHSSSWANPVDIDLKDAISHDTPLGGEAIEPRYISEMMADADEAAANSAGAFTDAQSPTVVEAEPEAVVSSKAAIAADVVNYLHDEAVYIVSMSGDITSYYPCHWRGEATYAEMQHRGLLLEWDDPAEYQSYITDLFTERYEGLSLAEWEQAVRDVYGDRIPSFSRLS